MRDVAPSSVRAWLSPAAFTARRPRDADPIGSRQAPVNAGRTATVLSSFLPLPDSPGFSRRTPSAAFLFCLLDRLRAWSSLQFKSRGSDRDLGPLTLLFGGAVALRRIRVSGAPAVCFFFVAAVAGVCLPAHADTPGVAAHGREKSRMCEGCHGVTDYRNAFPDVYRVPKLGEQQAAYIVKALQDYKSGARPHATMRSIAASLSDEDMADLAAYYASPTGQ